METCQIISDVIIGKTLQDCLTPYKETLWLMATLSGEETLPATFLPPCSLGVNSYK